MRYDRKRYKTRVMRERAYIFFTAALLVAAIAGLTARIALPAQSGEPYPDLYAGSIPMQEDAPSRTIYLTFDDGPSKNTEAILDILNEKGVKATFFVTAQGDNLDHTKEMYRRIVQEGHTIGLHSYTHDVRNIYRNVDIYLADIDNLNTLIIETTGVRPNIMRFPGGSRTRNCSKTVMREIIAELERRGYPYYDWDVVSGDDTATVYPAETLAKTVIKGIGKRDNAVVLFHDNPTPKTTPEAAAIVIDKLKEEGYRFDRLTANVKPVHIK